MTTVRNERKNHFFRPGTHLRKDAKCVLFVYIIIIGIISKLRHTPVCRFFITLHTLHNLNTGNTTEIKGQQARMPCEADEKQIRELYNKSDTIQERVTLIVSGSKGSSEKDRLKLSLGAEPLKQKIIEKNKNLILTRKK